VLAQGGAVFIYNTPQRSGRLTEWHQDIFAEVAEFCRARQPYCHKTQTVPQVAILHSESSYYMYNDPLFNFGGANEAMEGAMFALLENGYSVDIINEATLLKKLNDYPLVVIPEAKHVADEVKAALKGYVEQGGCVVLSGAFVAEQYGDLAGVAKADQAAEGGWLPAGNGAVKVSGNYQPTILQGAKALAPVLYQQEPKLNQHNFAAATLNEVGSGRVVAIHGDIFNNYYKARYPLMRQFIGDMVHAAKATGLAHVDGPWYIEMALRAKDNRTLVQFVNRSVSGYLSPNRHIVENVPDAGPFTVTLPMPEKPTRCYMAPDRVSLDWTWQDGILTANIGGLHIHNVMVIE